jgi:hypothetical protein
MMLEKHHMEYLPYGRGRILIVISAMGGVAEIRVHFGTLVVSQALMQMVGRSSAEEAGEVI